MITRQGLIDEARRIRKEIEQIFLDAEHWNLIHPEENPIDPDPDGTLVRMAKGIDEGLKREGQSFDATINLERDADADKRSS